MHFIVPALYSIALRYALLQVMTHSVIIGIGTICEYLDTERSQAIEYDGVFVMS